MVSIRKKDFYNFIHVLLKCPFQSIRSATECLSCHFCLTQSTHFTQIIQQPAVWTNICQNCTLSAYNQWWQQIPTFLLPMFSIILSNPGRFAHDAKCWKGTDNLKVAPILSIIKLLSQGNMVKEITLYSHHDITVLWDTWTDTFISTCK